jgi:L-alanine-DL-glutamate epimerase-like enolase superfamily enzyme
MHLNLSYSPFLLKFKHPFTVSGNSRTHTPIIIVELEYEGVTGYGECTMPPYLGESQETVMNFLKSIDLKHFESPFEMDAIFSYIDELQDGNNAAKAGFDIALHDLICKLKATTVANYYNTHRADKQSSFTIGIDTPAKMVEKTIEAMELGFKVLKVKLGSDNDQEIMQRILEVWNGPFSIDANQGWNTKESALDFVHYLKDEGASFVEQPFSKDDLSMSAWLTERSPLPIIADESCKRLFDIDRIASSFHGINVKLMKSTGLREAHQMIGEARKRNMKVVTGCMAESSCAVTAMANFASLADWVDLDGPFLITNDPFDGVQLIDGKLKIPETNGIGVERKD